MQRTDEIRVTGAAGKDRASSENEVIIGRIPRGYWGFVLFFMGFGFMASTCAYFDASMTNTLSGKIVSLCLAGFWWLIGLPLAWLVLRACVIADESGVRWRGMGGWKYATWPQVRDFYIKKRPKGSRSYIVETAAGNFDLDNLTHNARLRQIVSERARWAKSNTWEERSGKPEGLELSAAETFIVDNSHERLFWIMLVVVVLVLPLLMTLKAGPGLSGPVMAYRAVAQTWQTLGPLWALGVIAAFFFPTLAYGLMVFATWPMVREARRRRGQRITVSPYGLVWRDTAAGREVNAHWSEVRDFYLDEVPGWVRIAARGVVETERGTFDFVAMRNGTRLQALIQKYCAAHGLALEWQRQSSLETASLRAASASAVSPGAAGTSGARVYSYRQSEVRALIWLIVVMMLQMWIVFPLRILGWMPNAKAGDPSEWAMGAFFVVPLTVGSLWLLWNYFCFEIHVDENGITQRCGRRWRFIAWPDVREYEVSGGCIVVRGEDKTIRFWSLIGGHRDLQRQIKNRATNSLTRWW